MKTTLEGINSRITEAEERISDLEDKMVEFTIPMQGSPAYDILKAEMIRLVDRLVRSLILSVQPGVELGIN